MACRLILWTDALRKKSSGGAPEAKISEPASFSEFIDSQPESAFKDGRAAKLRIPPEAEGVQVNFCKNPSCSNFGIPASQTAARGEKAKAQPNAYTVVAFGAGQPALRCNSCGEHMPMKSNAGVAEELARMRDAGSQAEEPSCPAETCSSHSVPVSAGKAFYSAFGQTTIGSPRWKCKACGKTFSAARKSTHRQRDSHKNRRLLKALVSQMALRRIQESEGVANKTLRQRIDFFHRQALAFAADREAKLKTLPIRRLYLAVDRQDYQVNWTQRSDRRNIVLSAVVSVDNATRYVFAHHLNFDPSLDPKAIEADVSAINDPYKPAPFRKYARLWLKADYAASVAASMRKQPAGSLAGDIAGAYAQAQRRKDIEAPEAFTSDEKLPDMGMQIHGEYTLYAHFLYLKGLIGNAEKWRFFLDQDAGMRAACLAAFKGEILERRADAFFVSINKDLTVDQKRSLMRRARKEFDEAAAEMPDLKKEEVILALIKDRLANRAPMGKWKDRWLFHPLPDMGEPEKAICHLTDFGDYDEDHLAWLHNKASLHSADSYFMQIRRRVKSLERPLHSQGNMGRVWNGYAPYDPAMVQKMLDIFRVVHNYVLVSDKDKKTPAMRLGLAKAPLDYEDIIYFV